MARKKPTQNNIQRSKSGSEQGTKTSEVQALGVEYGADLNLPFSSPFNPMKVGVEKGIKDKKLTEVSRHGEDAGPSVNQLVTMRRMDGQARALYRLLTLPIRSALTTSTFVPAEGGEKEAEFIHDVFHLPAESGGMTVTFHRFMSQVLQGLFDGFAAFEKVFWIPDVGPLAGKVVLKKLAYRPADTVSFITDEHGGFAGFRQQTSLNGNTVDVYIPAPYAFYYAAQEEERKFYGISFFQSAFYHYDKKVKLYYTAHLAAQRAAVGTRVGTVPQQATKAAKAEFAQALARLSMAQWMMTPEGFKVDILREGGSYDFLGLINHHNNQMSKSVLANFFDQNTGGGKSDTSLVNFAQPGDDMFVLMLRAIMDDIANQINHYIIPQLIDLNFDSGNYPTFTWGTLTDEQRSAISATFDKVLTAGQPNATPEFLRALEKQVAMEMGLEIDYEAVEEREAAEAAAGGAEGFQGGPVAQPGAPGAGPEASEIPGTEIGSEIGSGDGQPVTQEMLGLVGDDWSLEDFETALLAYQQGEGEDSNEPEPTPEDEDEEIPLSRPSDPLLLLAAEMIELAKMEERRA